MKNDSFIAYDLEIGEGLFLRQQKSFSSILLLCVSCKRSKEAVLRTLQVEESSTLTEICQNELMLPLGLNVYRGNTIVIWTTLLKFLMSLEKINRN